MHPHGGAGGLRSRAVRVAAVSGPDPGHLLPVAAVARAMAARGHEAAVVTSERWHDDLRAEGIVVRTLPGVDRDRRDDDLGWRMWGRAGTMAGELRDVLDELRPDVVVSDTLTGAGGFAAELVGVPWVEVVPHWLWAPSPAVPPVGLGMAPPRTPFGRLYARHLRRQQRASFEQGRRQRAEARRSIGLPPGGGPRRRLLGTLPALELGRPDWPAATHVVGPLEWEPASWPELDPPSGGAPLVLVTDSTASNVQASVADTALAALVDEPVRLVLTTGRQLDAPPRVVVGRGRHGALLDAATCAVGHGGHGFVAKALARGVPLVVVPLQGDQRETAARVHRAGAGITVAPDDVSPATIREAVRRILGDASHARAAGRIAAGARGLGAPRAAQLIERRLAPRTSGRPRSATAS